MPRLDRLLSNLGYCSRKEVRRLLANSSVTVNGQPVTRPDTSVEHQNVLIDGEPLDPPSGSLTILLNKPVGYVCTFSEMEGSNIFELLPERFILRNPKLAPVGRLDKDSCGMLILTDDGTLSHRITSPKKHVPKRYRVKLQNPIRGNEAQIFASGNLLLEDETEPLKPAKLSVLDNYNAEIEITEGRYHQVRRMFTAVDNLVLELERIRIGELTLENLESGKFRFLNSEDLERVLQVSSS